jgi:cysteine synthase A
LARAVIEDAERRGLLRPGQTVVEATSGNTGIGLAMVCAQKGYPLVLTMAESFSVERRKLLRFLGARVVLTPASEKGTGMLNKAVELARTMAGSFAGNSTTRPTPTCTPAPPAQEILRDFAGERLYAFVTGSAPAGRCSALHAASRRRPGDPRDRRRARQLRRCWAAASGRRATPTAGRRMSHPQFRPHLMQGWSPDFISRLTETRSPRAWSTRSCPSAGTTRCAGRANWPRRRASSSASRAVRRWSRH